MGRILFIVVLLILSFAIIKTIKRRLGKPTSRKTITKKERSVVKCIHCGIHVPENEAIKQDKNVFCSLDHARHYLK